MFVSRSVDTFHEVKSKREKKKEVRFELPLVRFVFIFVDACYEELLELDNTFVYVLACDAQ